MCVHHREGGTPSACAEPRSPSTWAQLPGELLLSTVTTGAGAESDAGNSCCPDYKIDTDLSVSSQNQSFSIKAANFKERGLLS